jgi:3'(2'), 5'-bisphosphate nucleotidase
MWEREIEEMKNAALLAEKKILEVYHSTFEVETKSDDSPVTEADKAADKIIKDYLKERFPDYAFLTEESVDTKERLHKDLLFIIAHALLARDMAEHGNMIGVDAADRLILGQIFL